MEGNRGLALGLQGSGLLAGADLPPRAGLAGASTDQISFLQSVQDELKSVRKKLKDAKKEKKTVSLFGKLKKKKRKKHSSDSSSESD
jgi:hypothetical protein